MTEKEPIWIAPPNKAFCDACRKQIRKEAEEHFKKVKMQTRNTLLDSIREHKKEISRLKKSLNDQKVLNGEYQAAISQLKAEKELLTKTISDHEDHIFRLKAEINKRLEKIEKEFRIHKNKGTTGKEYLSYSITKKKWEELKKGKKPEEADK